jgi:hypothetical protein
MQVINHPQVIQSRSRAAEHKATGQRRHEIVFVVYERKGGWWRNHHHLRVCGAAALLHELLGAGPVLLILSRSIAIIVGCDRAFEELLVPAVAVGGL